MARKTATKTKAATPLPAPDVSNQVPATAPNPRDAQLPAAQPELEPAPRGLEEIGREDMVIPRFSIVQPTSENGTAGNIRDQVSGDEFEALEYVVLLKVRKGRVYFAEPDAGGGVLCASDDRIAPAKRIEHPVQAACAGCPMAAWSTVGGKRKHPKCQETYTFLLAVDGLPYFMTFKSGAIKDVKKLLTQLTLRCRKERLDVFGYQFGITTEEVKFDVGKAYMPRFTDLAKVSKADYELYSELFDAFANQEPTFDDAPAEAVADGGDAQGDFPFGENA